ncbi:MAG TPA: hypothetical protein VNJ08_07485 [Bacteriovoracaceae bacterium]|nr:hypothetical protein [Bacteriovoracaceae bacterium]
MNILSTLTAMAFICFILTEAVLFHQSTVCRQKTWQMGVESITRTLLTNRAPSEHFMVPGCKTMLIRTAQNVRWKANKLHLELRGKL